MADTARERPARRLAPFTHGTPWTAAADAVLAWLAEPQQVGAMAAAHDSTWLKLIDTEPREACTHEAMRAAIAALASEGDDATGGLVTGSGG